MVAPVHLLLAFFELKEPTAGLQLPDRLCDLAATLKLHERWHFELMLILSDSVDCFADPADSAVAIVGGIPGKTNARPSEVVIDDQLDALLAVFHSAKRSPPCYR